MWTKWSAISPRVGLGEEQPLPPRRRTEVIELRSRQRQTHDPCVAHVFEPVLVEPPGDSAFAPTRAPGVLHVDPLLVVTDDGEGVAVLAPAQVRNLAVPDVAALPALVHTRAGVDHPDLVERRVIVGEPLPHPVVCTERRLSGVLRSLDAHLPVILAFDVPRELLGADAHVPAANRGATA